MRRKFLLSFLLLLAIPVAVYIGFPWFAKPVLNLMLSGKNLTIDTLQVNRPDWNSIVIQELRLDYAGLGQIAIAGADIHFRNWPSEYQILIEQITVVLAAAEDADKQEASPRLAEYLPENLLPRIPTVGLTVHAIHIDRADDNHQVPLARLENARLTNSPDGLDLSVIMIREKKHAIFLTATPDNKFALAMNPAAVDRFKLQLTGLFGNSSNGIKVKSAVDTDFRQPIYFNTRLDDTLGGFVGRFRSEMQVTIANLPIDEILARPVVNARGLIEANFRNPARGIKLETGMAFQLKLDRNDWEIDLATLPGSASDALKLEMEHDNKQHTVNIVLPKPIKLNGTQESNSIINANPESVIEVRYQANESFIASARLDDINWNGFYPDENEFSASLNVDIDANARNLLALMNMKAVQLYNSTLRFSTGVELRSGLFKLNIKENTNLLAERLISNQTVLNSVNITLPPQEIIVDFDRISTTPIGFTFNVDDLTSNNYQIALVRINGEALLNKSQVRFSLINEKAGLRKSDKDSKSRSYNIPPYRVVGELDLQNSTLAGVNSQLLNQCDKPILNAKWQPNGNVTISADHTFSKQDSLRRWLNLRELTADIPQGRLVANLEWDTSETDAPPRINVALSQADITGSLGIFDNVQLLLSTPKSKSNGKYTLEASADNVNIGTDVTDMILQAGFTRSEAGVTAQIHEVSGKLLGGRAFIENQQWTIGQPSLIDLHLENLDLAELVKTQDIESITTTGQLTGVIPIKLNKDGDFSLAGGRLSDINGGTIRYQSTPAESEGLNEQLQLTLDVLRNFKYDVLNTQIEYDDGNLVLKSNIQGSNPDVAGGQEIDLNLNTEVGLKSAFQAMRLQAGLEAQVENLYATGTESSLPFCQQPL